MHSFIDKDATEMHFNTLSGELVVTKEDNGYTLDFPVGKTKPIALTKDIMEATDYLAKEAKGGF